MTNNIANKKSVCNAALLLLSVCYTGVLQITNKKLKTLCIKDVFIMPPSLNYCYPPVLLNHSL